jgi:uncharacterized protein (TIGR03083 family)
MDRWQAVDEERSALADDLETLDAGRWDVQSLCSQWKVRHVVGHLIAGADLKAGPFFVGLFKSGMNFNRFMACGGLARGTAPLDKLLDQFRKTIGMHRAAPGANSEIMLVDIVCHSVDIRRPVGMRRSVPEATLLTVADLVKRIGFPFQAKKRIAGLRMSATDVGWSAGEGPVVEAGRTALLEDLSGEGTQILHSRM